MPKHPTRRVAGGPRSLTGARSGRPLRTCSALLLIALVASGCGEDTRDRGTTYQPEGFQPDVATYRLPLDGYLPDRAEDEYARNILVQQCMQKASIAWPIPGLSSTSRPPTLNAMGRKLFTLTFAKQFGYHTGPTVTPADPLQGRALPDAEKAAFESCAKEADSQIGVSRDTRNLVESMQSAAYETASQGSTRRALEAKWRTCMLDAKVSEVPDGPAGMPTPTQRKRWFGAPALGETSGHPASIGGPEEIRIATIDANCRVSTGYAAGAYQAEVDAQIALMSNSQEALERALANTRRANDVIRRALQQHG